MKKSTALMSMLAMGAMMSETWNPLENDPTDIKLDHIPFQPKPPTGTKEYFFDYEGEFSTESMLKEDVVFKCYAINNKNAIRKYKKFLKK